MQIHHRGRFRFLFTLLLFATLISFMATPCFSQGINLVADIVPGPDSSYPKGFTVFRDELYFSAQYAAYSKDVLYKYDGTTIRRIGDVEYPSRFAVFNNELYFSARTDAAGWELFKYDGSNVSLVADISQGPANSHPAELTTLNNELLFTAEVHRSPLSTPLTALIGPIYQRCLFKYDGKTVSLVAEVGAESLTVFGNELFFWGQEGQEAASLRKLYKYDGKQVSVVSDITPTFWRHFAVLKSRDLKDMELLFEGDNGSGVGAELYRYDGKNISLVADINRGSGGSLPEHLTSFRNEVLFTATDGSSREFGGQKKDNYFLYKYDGKNVRRVSDSHSNEFVMYQYSNEFVMYDDKLFLVEHHFDFDSLKWKQQLSYYDGKTITHVMDVGDGLVDPTVFKNQLLFGTKDADHGKELGRFTIRDR